MTTTDQPPTVGRPRNRRPKALIIVLATAAGLALLALTLWLGLSAVTNATRSALPEVADSPAPITAPTDDNELPVAPAEDLTMAAGADLPAGFDVMLGSSFSGDGAWEPAHEDADIQRYRHIETGCTVRFSASRFDAGSDDDMKSTVAGLSDAVDVDFSRLEASILTLPYNPTGAAGIIGNEGGSEYRIELAAYPAKNPDGVLITAGRVISSIDRIIIFELACPNEEDLSKVGSPALEMMSVGLIPAALVDY